MKTVRRLLLAFLLLPWPGFALPAEAADECVILLHGLWRSKLSMKALEWELVDQGYRVVNIGYPSTNHPIEELAVMAVEKGLRGCRDSGPARINFVTHSLGGILVRQYLSGNEIPELHRVVMLAPPNQGSHLADFLLSIDKTDELLPQAARQLGTDAGSIPRQLGAAHFELGVIAGTTNRRPFTPGAPKEESDGTVGVAETRLEGMRDFVAVPATHTFIMWQSAVLDQVVFFLRHGRFRHETSPVERR